MHILQCMSGRELLNHVDVWLSPGPVSALPSKSPCADHASAAVKCTNECFFAEFP